MLTIGFCRVYLRMLLSSMSMLALGGSIQAKGPLFLPQLATDNPELKAVRLVYGTGQQVLQFAYEQSTLLSQAVFFATQVTGRAEVVTTGTIVQGVDGQFRYENKPESFLLIKRQHQSDIELHISRFEGVFEEGPVDFLSRDHVIAFETKHNGDSVTIASMQVNGEKIGEINGIIRYKQQPIEVSCSYQGDYQFNVDASGSLYESDIDLTGTLVGDQMSLLFNEKHVGRIVSASWNGQHRIVSSAAHDLMSTLTVAGDVYEAHIQSRKVFRNGSPTEPEFWQQTGGTIRKNNHRFGRVNAVYEFPYAKIRFVSEDGQIIDLESWRQG